MARKERLALIEKIQGLRSDRLCIAYITSTRSGQEIAMADDVIRLTYDHLHASREKAKNGVDLFIHSNGGQGTVPWRLVSLIREYTEKFAVGNQNDWCNLCGNSTGACSPSVLSGSGSGSTSSPSSTPSSGSSSGVSKAVAGVIGAVVTLAVILGAEIFIMLVAGLRLVSKKRLAAGSPAGSVGGTTPAKA